MTDRQTNLDTEYLFHSLINEPSLARRQILANDLKKRIGEIGAPLIVNNRVYFLYFGSAQSVAIAGDWTRWRSVDALQRIPGVNVFYLQKTFPDTARLQYKIIVNGDWILDPANSLAAQEGFGTNSEFIMPEYLDRSWLKINHKRIRRGALRRYEIDSDELGASREVYVYSPPLSTQVRKRREVCLAIIHDGAESLSIGRFDNILNHLHTAGKILPTAALFIAPVHRNDEYALNEAYIRFCLYEAKPFAERALRTEGFRLAAQPNRTCVVGASLGGLLATATALRSPDSIGAFIAQSPAYWWQNKRIYSSPDILNASAVCGVLQTGAICDARENTLLMYGLLKDKGARVRYQETSQGHTWGNWRSMFAPGILAWMDQINAA